MRKRNQVELVHLIPSLLPIKVTTLSKIKPRNNFNIIASAIILSLYITPDKVLAACNPAAASGVTITCNTTSIQATPVGTGPGLDNVIVNVLPTAQINTGESSAISLDSNATITLQDSSVVQNNSHALPPSGFWNTGQNTIEFNSNSVLTLSPGAEALGLGSNSNNTIAGYGGGNTIINYGLIESQSAYPIWFSASALALRDTVDNYGTITATNSSNVAIISDAAAVNIINHTGGVIIGSIYLSSGSSNLTLESGSTLDSAIVNGVGGVNYLYLVGAAASSPPTGNVLSANIINFFSLIKNGDSEWTISSPLSNSINIIVNDGTLTLAGNNVYTGNTTLNGGTLAAQAAGAFSPNSAYIIAAPGAMDLNGFSQTIASVSNAGVINLNGADAGTELTVTGNYVGNNGRLNFNARLSDDASQSERLIVVGNTSGDTQVTVNNAGGSGAQTIDGIELISVNGASDGEFIQSGRIVAGAYDYTLARGTGAAAPNWYLVSSTATPVPEPPGTEPPGIEPPGIEPPGIEPPGIEPPLQPIPDPHPDPGDMVERPEDSSYGANLAAANTLFAAGRDTRSVLTAYIDPITGQQQTTSLWMTNVGGHNRSRDDSGQLRTQSNRYVLQLGGDVGQWSSDGADSFRLGVMAGYGHARSNTDSQVSGYRSKGSVDGYSVGLYGTWYADAAGHDGLYVDGWTQYGWFDNEVNGQDLNEQDYKSKGFTASLETGYAFTIGANPANNATYYIEPQAQAIWMDVKADDLTEDNGTRVSGDGDGNIQTRLGVKAYMNAYSERDKNKDRLFQPFIEANWIHNSKDFGATLNGVTVSQDGAANIGELKLGVNGQLNKNFNLWGSVGQQVGNKGYSDTTGMLGLKYLF